MRWRPVLTASCLVAFGCADGRAFSDAAAPRNDATVVADASALDARALDAARLDTSMAELDAREADAATTTPDATPPDACVTEIYFADADGDGYGGFEARSACIAPAGFVLRDGDCNDADGSVHPGITDVCDGVEQDCTPGESCPSGCRAASYGGHGYAYCLTGTSWTAARDHCASVGMQLVRIDSGGENSFVGDLGGVSNLWIGANDRASEGNFVWIDGGSITSRHWTSGYPNGSGDCARMNPDDQWVDVDCTRTYDFVCESR